MLRSSIRIPALYMFLGMASMSVIMFMMQEFSTSTTPCRFHYGKVSDPKQSHLLVLSTWRSGSSLFGQIFSQHPDVFYLIEPCWHTWKCLRGVGATGMQPACRDMLRSIYQCDTSIYNYYEQSPPPKTGRTMSSIFMYGVSRALCSPPACNAFAAGTITEENVCRAKCSKRPFEAASLACEASKHIVFKEVRFMDLEPLKPLLTDPNIDLRIIHLVRDPRAIAFSRIKSASNFKRDNGIVMNMSGTNIIDDKQKVLGVICKSIERMRSVAREDNMPSWLQGHYMLVRYEDFVKNVESTLTRMFNFARIPENVNVSHWIMKNTHGKRVAGGAFGVVLKDATAISQKWRKYLPFNSVLNIQNVCGGMMKAYGYRFIVKKEQLMNMEFDVVDNLPENVNSHTQP
uniref:carbohydrate sulfotransferase 5-like n=1 Tax=Myxine glutinosa TaxID=7769 RepID=UPI00358DFBB8